jgi:hypothetical protein
MICRGGQVAADLLKFKPAAVRGDPLIGLVSAHVHFSVAAELAETVASKPGSFAATFIDALGAVDEYLFAAVRKSTRRFSSNNVEPTSHIEMLGAFSKLERAERCLPFTRSN